MEAAADYQYAPLRIPPGTSRSAAATMLSLQADTGGWELARLQLHADGTRKVILRRRARRCYPAPRWRHERTSDAHPVGTARAADHRGRLRARRAGPRQGGRAGDRTA